MKKNLSILFVLLLVSVTTYAQFDSNSIIVDLKEKSALSIHGKSNVVDFKFSQPSNSFIDDKLFVTASWKNDCLYLNEKTLSIPVKSFTSSNKMALRDFRKLIKSEEYPIIQIELDHINLSDNSAESLGNAVIDVTITNVTKRYTFPIKSGKNGTNITFDVTKDISIRDFNLTPPVQMMGMLKVDEWITINLFMECAIQPMDQAKLENPPLID